MAKSFTLSNGNFLIGLDAFGQVGDVYFPYVGLENHVGGRLLHKMGIYSNGEHYWFDDGSFKINLTCENHDMSSLTTVVHKKTGLTFVFEDVVYNEKNIFVRNISIKNTHSEPISFTFYINQQFSLYESHRGDTAYYDPTKKVIVHYKGRRNFLINSQTNFATGIDDYSIGLFGIEGKEGTFRDAEDGVLSKNAIEHGVVDSTIGTNFTIEPDGTQTMAYWICAGKTLNESFELNEYILQKSPAHLIESTKDYWKAWVDKNDYYFCGLNEEVSRLFKQSLVLIRSHVDNRGAIIASCDSDMLKSGRDTYAYMWPRDGALTAFALDTAGYHEVTQRFYMFCKNVLMKDGYLMHKYRPDESLGSSWHPWVHKGHIELPIQEDETALVLRSLWNFYEKTKNLEFVEDIYNPFIKTAADFMLLHTLPNGLPKPSYDLWEQHFCISTFTSCAVYSGLMSAANFAKVLGKEKEAYQYSYKASTLKKAIEDNLFDEEKGYFIKMLEPVEGGFTRDTTLDMASVYGVFAFDVLGVDDDRVKRSIQAVHTQLELHAPTIGGVPRYQDDTYFKDPTIEESNPWIITTLWLAQYSIKTAQNQEDFNTIVKTLSWVAEYAHKTGVLPEQLHPYSGQHLSAAPLTWSHAEFVTTVLMYLEKLEEKGLCILKGE